MQFLTSIHTCFLMLVVSAYRPVRFCVHLIALSAASAGGTSAITDALLNFSVHRLRHPVSLRHHRYRRRSSCNSRRRRRFLLEACWWSSVVLRIQCVLCFIASVRCLHCCCHICPHLGASACLSAAFMYVRHRTGLSAQNVSTPPLAFTFQVIQGASFDFLGKGYNDSCLLNIVSSSQVRERNEALMKKDRSLRWMSGACAKDVAK